MKKAGKGETDRDLPSRWEEAQGRGEDIAFPPLDWDDSLWGDRVAGWLLEAGPVYHGGMGIVGLPWAELAHWSDLTCIYPDPWEAEALFMLSGVYASMLDRAKDPTEPPYWRDADAPQPTAADISRVMDQMVTATKK